VATKENSKNFFYDLEVISYDGKRTAKLTPQIKRLIEAVEIQETEATGGSGGQELTNAVTITMTETDYLPQDGGLRPQDPRVFGQITNRPSSLLDLRFDSEKGYTFVSKEEVESGITDAARNQLTKEEPVIFLFQKRNRLRVTWGYLEPYSSRTEEYEITIASVEGSQSGHGKVTVQALNREIELRRAFPENGITFILDPERNIKEQQTPVIPFQKLSLKQTLFKVTEAMGLKLIFDGEEVRRYPPGTDKYDELREEGDDSAPPDKPFRITSKMSYYEFIKQLADDFQSYVSVRTINDEQTLVFNKTSLVFSEPRETLTYKDKDGLVLNYKIKDESGLFDSPNSGFSIADDGIKKDSRYVNQQLVKDDVKTPKRTNTDNNERHNYVLRKPRVGKSEAIPSNGNEDKLAQQVDSESYSRSYFNTIDLTLIGDPLFIPGTYEVQNVGARYSGEYKMFGVKHSLSTSGYEIQMQGKRNSTSEGGISARSQQDEAKSGETLDEQLLDPEN